MRLAVPAAVLALLDALLGPALGLCPLLVGFTGLAAVLLHVLGAVLIVLWTRAALTPPRRLRPLDPALLPGVQVAGWILVVLPWFLGFQADAPARWTLLLAGLALLASSAIARPVPAAAATQDHVPAA